MNPVDAWAREALAAIDQQGLRRTLEPLESPQGAVVRVAGRALLNFSSNDYLSLANHPHVVTAARAALEQLGAGSGASRLIVGDFTVHQALEARLAQFLGTPAALLFNSGYAANVGLVSTLAQDGDVIFSDELNHASLIDGCRLSRARTVVYRHGQVAHLAELLEQFPGRRQLIATDAVFSMDGDLAPLVELQALARARGAALLVDEAHAIGVLGPTGAGLCEALGVTPDVRMGTLGKALGSFGAWVGTSRDTADWLLNRARSFVFSTSLPASACAAALAALDVLQARAPAPADDGWMVAALLHLPVSPTTSRRERLWQVITRFNDGLRALGQGGPAQSAIASVIFGTPERALAASQFLRERGVLAKAIRPPTVPDGTSRVRFTLCADHTDAHVDTALAALDDLLKGQR